MEVDSRPGSRRSSFTQQLQRILHKQIEGGTDSETGSALEFVCLPYTDPRCESSPGLQAIVARPLVEAEKPARKTTVTTNDLTGVENFQPPTPGRESLSTARHTPRRLSDLSTSNEDIYSSLATATAGNRATICVSPSWDSIAARKKEKRAVKRLEEERKAVEKRLKKLEETQAQRQPRRLTKQQPIESRSRTSSVDSTASRSSFSHITAFFSGGRRASWSQASSVTGDHAPSIDLTNESPGESTTGDSAEKPFASAPSGILSTGSKTPTPQGIDLQGSLRSGDIGKTSQPPKVLHTTPKSSNLRECWRLLQPSAQNASRGSDKAQAPTPGAPGTRHSAPATVPSVRTPEQARNSSNDSGCSSPTTLISETINGTLGSRRNSTSSVPTTPCSVVHDEELDTQKVVSPISPKRNYCRPCQGSADSQNVGTSENAAPLSVTARDFEHASSAISSPDSAVQSPYSTFKTSPLAAAPASNEEILRTSDNNVSARLSDNRKQVKPRPKVLQKQRPLSAISRTNQEQPNDNVGRGPRQTSSTEDALSMTKSQAATPVDYQIPAKNPLRAMPESRRSRPSSIASIGMIDSAHENIPTSPSEPTCSRTSAAKKEETGHNGSQAARPRSASQDSSTRSPRSDEYDTAHESLSSASNSHEDVSNPSQPRRAASPARPAGPPGARVSFTKGATPPMSAGPQMPNFDSRHTSKELKHPKPGNLVAKVFIICCHCRLWHDMPAETYAQLPGLSSLSNRSYRRATWSTAETSGVRGSHKSEQVKSSGAEKGEPSTQCCWCHHQMTKLCCEGWTAVVQMRERHH